MKMARLKEMNCIHRYMVQFLGLYFLLQNFHFYKHEGIKRSRRPQDSCFHRMLHLFVCSNCQPNEAGLAAPLAFLVDRNGEDGKVPASSRQTLPEHYNPRVKRD